MFRPIWFFVKKPSLNFFNCHISPPLLCFGYKRKKLLVIVFHTVCFRYEAIWFLIMALTLCRRKLTFTLSPRFSHRLVLISCLRHFRQIETQLFIVRSLFLLLYSPITFLH